MGRPVGDGVLDLLEGHMDVVCGRTLGRGFESFFGQVLYAAGKGFRIRFWHDPWSRPTTLKDLYPAMFAIVVDKIAMISDMVDFAPDGGGRSWNLRFHHAFQDWETWIFYDFFCLYLIQAT